MQKTSKSLWCNVVSFVALMCVMGGGVNAASRSMMPNGNGQSTTARMPTMPTMSINTVGTTAISGVTTSGNVTPITPTPTPITCPDGGVANSELTVDGCMQSISACIQGGALPNGLNNLFSEDLRNSIINGMGVCATQIDQCIHGVRVDCQNVYDSSVDVWLDFNSRVIQPEYYNFVLRKTGLTPNQAENVCGLLDRNTYGSSFSAVSSNGKVTTEYENDVNAYNNQVTLSKTNPQGPTVNTDGKVDSVRGHYARWDPIQAVCKVRVAAYNKNDLITNKWLFGAVGDDRSAEVWRDAGATFTCNKDLFDFSLMNDTKTAAVVGVGSGTVLGASVGAIVGATADKAKDFACDDAKMRENLYKVLKEDGALDEVNKFLDTTSRIIIGGSGFTKESCESIKTLYAKMFDMQNAIDLCSGFKCDCKFSIDGVILHITDCSDNVNPFVKQDEIVINGNVHKLGTGVDVTKLQKEFFECKEGWRDNQKCSFHSLRQLDESVICAGGKACITADIAQQEVNTLKDIFASAKLEKVFQGKKSGVVKDTLIGAGVGAAAGGVATAITAFVERNNISCHVGDGLDTVGFGKSYTIESLKDFYVKWNLRVADSITPTARVTSCDDWISSCGLYTTAEDCSSVAINYQRPGSNTTTLVHGACTMSGSVCIEDRAVAISYGACSRSVIINPRNPLVNTGTLTSIQH